jgi:hypothetical protein
MWSLILNYFQTLLSLKVVSRYQCCYVGDPLEYWAYQESCLSKSERYTFLYISFLLKVLIIVVARSFIFICFQTLLWNKVVYRRWRCSVIAPWKNKLNVSPWNIIFNLVWVSQCSLHVSLLLILISISFQTWQSITVFSRCWWWCLSDSWNNKLKCFTLTTIFNVVLVSQSTLYVSVFLFIFQVLTIVVARSLITISFQTLLSTKEVLLCKWLLKYKLNCFA